MKNKSKGKEWTEDGFCFREVIRQEYPANHCIFSTGFVSGHSKNSIFRDDTMYLRFERDDVRLDEEGNKPFWFFMRPDEMAAIAWVATGILWSNHIAELEKQDKKLEKKMKKYKKRRKT
jgi:hypothetical protein